MHYNIIPVLEIGNSSEKLSSLFKITQLVNGRATIMNPGNLQSLYV